MTSPTTHPSPASQSEQRRSSRDCFRCPLCCNQPSLAPPRAQSGQGSPGSCSCHGGGGGPWRAVIGRGLAVCSSFDLLFPQSIPLHRFTYGVHVPETRRRSQSVSQSMGVAVHRSPFCFSPLFLSFPSPPPLSSYTQHTAQQRPVSSSSRLLPIPSPCVGDLPGLEGRFVAVAVAVAVAAAA